MRKAVLSGFAVAAAVVSLLTIAGCEPGHGTFLTADSAELSAWVAKSTDPELFNVLGTFKEVDTKFPKPAAKTT